jgi:hypothetical protein
MGLGAVVVVLAVVTAGGLSGYMAIENGYVPIKVLAGLSPMLSSLKDVPPPGNATESTIAQVSEKYPQIMENIATQMPHYNDILIKLYSTSATLDEIATFYNNWLTAKGFTCIRSGHMDVGNLDIGVIPIYYYGYEKGLTGVGIVMTDNNPGASLVVYTTGYSSHYVDIVPWLEQQRANT